jgi:hypothetical protein
MPNESLTQIMLTRTPLPVEFRPYPGAIAAWIDWIAPCVVGTQSQATFDMIRDHLRGRGISGDRINKAFSLSRYKWPASSVTLPTSPGAVSYTVTPQTSMSTSTIDPVTQAEILARNYRIARMNHDLPKMRLLAAAFRIMWTQASKSTYERLMRDAELFELRRLLRERNGEVEIDESAIEDDAGGEADAEAP